MKCNKGFTAITLVIIVAIIVLASVAYIAFKPEILESPTEKSVVK